MDGLEVGELVVVCVDAGAEEEAGVAAVDDLVVAELDKVGLVLLVARGDEAVDLALELDLFVVAVGGVPLGEAGLAPAQEREVWLARRFNRKRGGSVVGLLAVLDKDEGEHGGALGDARERAGDGGRWREVVGDQMRGHRWKRR